MTTLADKARAEAEAAEAEEHDDEQTDEPVTEPDDELEPETEQHPAEGLEEPTDAMIVELQAACNDHHDHVHAIMGPFVDGFVPCESCNGIGIAYPQPSGPKLQPAPGLVLCSVCKGPGDLETPSTRPGFELIQCVNCGGKGYVGNLAGVPHATQAAVESYPQTNDGNSLEQPAAPQPESTDPFVAEAEQRGYIVLRKPGT